MPVASRGNGSTRTPAAGGAASTATAASGGEATEIPSATHDAVAAQLTVPALLTANAAAAAAATGKLRQWATAAREPGVDQSVIKNWDEIDAVELGNP